MKETNSMSPHIPDFQIATLAATAAVLMGAFECDEPTAIRVAVDVDIAIKEALEGFGPELTLAAAERLWDQEYTDGG